MAHTREKLGLNSAALKKIKKKKHRPKVMDDSKPNKTPKPITPIQAKEKQHPIRQYSRKKINKGNVDQQTSASKSVRRSLNFDSDERSIVVYQASNVASSDMDLVRAYEINQASKCHEMSPNSLKVYKRKRTKKRQGLESTIDEECVSGQMFEFGTQKKQSALPARVCEDCMLPDLRLKSRTKKGSKTRQAHPVSSMVSSMAQNSLAGNFEAKDSNHKQNSPIQECRSSNLRVSARVEVPSLAIVGYVDPKGEIVQRLRRRSVNVGGKMMILPKYRTKKHRPRARAKVDLDPGTKRAWNLLMEKKAQDETDDSDMDTDQKWEEQRRIFGGRVESFIARMRLVQGDRRFSQWKGSVVDSVVGVYLTQNVSDHLSSSAFMSLAARFPVQSKASNTEFKAEKVNISTEDRVGSIFQNDDDTLKSQEDINDVGVRDQGSTMTHDQGSKSSTSSVECRHIKENMRAQKPNYHDAGRVSSTESNNAINRPEITYINDGTASDGLNKVKCACSSIYIDNSNPKHEEYNFKNISIVASKCSHSHCTRSAHASTSAKFSQVQNERITKFQQDEWNEDSQVENTQNKVGIGVQIKQCKMQSTCSNCCEILIDLEPVESKTKSVACSSKEGLQEVVKSVPGAKSVKAGIRKHKFDWDRLRKEACGNGDKRERSKERLDSLDWEAVRNANVDEVSKTIKKRGMNNVLAKRIKDFLHRVARDHGSIDLEWLRDTPSEKAKEYLLSIHGLGLKSAECVRLLTLNHHAFPVDTNVARIFVRLGWVPLQPLPESLQLHLLKLYPVIATVQKYLWPRLCSLNLQTLYELHCQMITFGKVFCRKRRPNCTVCPMRGECRHFASEFASSRLALPGPEKDCHLVLNPLPLSQFEGSKIVEEMSFSNSCEPITPERKNTRNLESDIEDFGDEDPNKIPQIEVNLKRLTENLLGLFQENNVVVQVSDISKAIVAITAEAASIPMPKLKNVNRLRTEHQVYELPDKHPLLEGMDPRENDDPCPYLLAIWTPGETARSTEPPKTWCSSHDMGKLCPKRKCFACNSIREAQAQTVRGTILIPCRTAMRGSFPLNGTYFQVNEVFADHESSCKPLNVPTGWIWNLPRRTTYFGASVSAIFRDVKLESIQHCFWRGYICLRGFDRTTRKPRLLRPRFHCKASSTNRKGAAMKG